MSRLHYIKTLLKNTLSSYKNHDCLLRAAALTYVTILSIVPFLAVAFSISKGLGFYNSEFVYKLLLKLTANRETIVKNIITYINNTNVGKLGGIGMTTLLLVVLSLLGTIEDTLNTIFQIPSNRNIKSKITHYFSITMLSPIFILVVATLISSLSSISLVKRLLSYSLISHIYILLLKVLPFFIIWLSIYLLFSYLPNGKVKKRGILIGSLVASIIWQVLRLIFIYYDPFKFRYNAIYGSFAKVILIFLWMFFSWCILLFGAVLSQEINYTYQKPYSFKRKLGYFNLEIKEKIFLLIISFFIESFNEGDGVASCEEVASSIAIPPPITEDFLRALEEMGFLYLGKEGYILSRDTSKCTMGEFLQHIRTYSDIPSIHPRTYLQALIPYPLLGKNDPKIKLKELSLELKKLWVKKG